MRLRLTTIALSALLMGGCASETPSQPPAPAFYSTSAGLPIVSEINSRAPALSQWPDTLLPELFVSTDTDFVITMWRNSFRVPIGQFKPPTAPLGIVFDRSGNLFVVAGGNEGWIYVYPPPYKKPSIYTKRVPYFPTQLGIGPDGTLYAADIDGNVYAFANGSKTPTLVIPLPTDGNGPSRGQGFAFDSHGNVFISYDTYFDQADDVIMCPAQSASCTRLNLQLVNTPNVASPGNIAFDTKGNLVLAEGNNPLLGVYNRDRSSPTGYSSKPSRLITINGSVAPGELAFNVAKKRLYVGDTWSSSVFVLSWPTANIVHTYSVASPVYSIALWPGAPQ